MAGQHPALVSRMVSLHPGKVYILWYLLVPESSKWIKKMLFYPVSVGGKATVPFEEAEDSFPRDTKCSLSLGILSVLSVPSERLPYTHTHAIRSKHYHFNKDEAGVNSQCFTMLITAFADLLGDSLVTMLLF